MWVCIYFIHMHMHMCTSIHLSFLPDPFSCLQEISINSSCVAVLALSRAEKLQLSPSTPACVAVPALSRAEKQQLQLYWRNFLGVHPSCQKKKGDLPKSSPYKVPEVVKLWIFQVWFRCWKQDSKQFYGYDRHAWGSASREKPSASAKKWIASSSHNGLYDIFFFFIDK